MPRHSYDYTISYVAGTMLLNIMNNGLGDIPVIGSDKRFDFMGASAALHGIYDYQKLQSSGD